jgi:CBS domain-containing protein
MNAGQICNREVVIAYRDTALAEAARLMREHGVRRVPVLSSSGALAGILTIDDLLDQVAEELGDLVRTIGRERTREARLRPA